MTNVTITMDEETARWVRIEAAKAGKSVSRWLGELLAARRRAEADAAWEAGREARQEAMAKFLAIPARDIGYHGVIPDRETLYEEALRRHEPAGVREGSNLAFEASKSDDVARGARSRRGRRAQRTKPA
jgi:hypothetical protein